MPVSKLTLDPTKPKLCVSVQRGEKIKTYLNPSPSSRLRLAKVLDQRQPKFVNGQRIFEFIQ